MKSVLRPIALALVSLLCVAAFSENKRTPLEPGMKRSVNSVPTAADLVGRRVSTICTVQVKARDAANAGLAAIAATRSAASAEIAASATKKLQARVAALTAIVKDACN